MRLEIIADEPGFLVVNKPQGLVCHPTKGDEYSSLISRARLHLGSPAFLVNRLDRETSGVVLIAKSAEVAGELGRLFELRGVRKHYAAVVHGHVVAEEGCIDSPLGKDHASEVAIKDCVRPDGAAASTQFAVERRFVRDGHAFSVLRVTPLSGRKHQIRIHLAHIGHPIVGDKLYGVDAGIYLRFVRGAMTQADVAALLLSNQALHASRIEFEWRGRAWSFEAPLPDVLRQFLQPG